MELDTKAVEDMTLGQLRELVGPVSLEYAPCMDGPTYIRLSWNPSGCLCNMIMKEGCFVYFRRRLVQENPFPMDSDLISDVIHYESTKYVGLVFLNIIIDKRYERMTLKELGQLKWN